MGAVYDDSTYGQYTTSQRIGTMRRIKISGSLPRVNKWTEYDDSTYRGELYALENKTSGGTASARDQNTSGALKHFKK